MASLIAPDGLPHQAKEGSEGGRLWWCSGRWWAGAKGSVGKGRGVLRSSDCYSCATTAPGWQALDGTKRSVCMQRCRPDMEGRARALRCMRVLSTALAPPPVSPQVGGRVACEMPEQRCARDGGARDGAHAPCDRLYPRGART